MAFLMEYIVKNEPDILTFTREDAARVYSQTGGFHDAENTNDYIDEIPGLIGSKTGYTDLAGGNLVVAFDAGLNRPYRCSCAWLFSGGSFYRCHGARERS
jgi:D-alanyl-D-alanine carboxypeptidase